MPVEESKREREGDTIWERIRQRNKKKHRETDREREIKGV